MNLFGIGPLEVLVIFLVAFLALGPGKSIEMARTTGKVLRDLRRTFDEVASAVSLDEVNAPPSQNSRPQSSGSTDSARQPRPTPPPEDSPPQNRQ